jgi:hypothetical protein
MQILNFTEVEASADDNFKQNISSLIAVEDLDFQDYDALILLVEIKGLGPKSKFTRTVNKNLDPTPIGLQY